MFKTHPKIVEMYVYKMFINLLSFTHNKHKIVGNKSYSQIVHINAVNIHSLMHTLFMLFQSVSSSFTHNIHTAYKNYYKYILISKEY